MTTNGEDVIAVRCRTQGVAPAPNAIARGQGRAAFAPARNPTST